MSLTARIFSMLCGMMCYVERSLHHTCCCALPRPSVCTEARNASTEARNTISGRCTKAIAEAAILHGCLSCRESTGLGGPLNEEEYHVIQGVLDLGHKKGIRGMTPLDKVKLAAAMTW